MKQYLFKRAHENSARKISLWYLNQDLSLRYLSKLSDVETSIHIAAAKNTGLLSRLLPIRGFSTWKKQNHSASTSSSCYLFLRLNHGNCSWEVGVLFFCLAVVHGDKTNIKHCPQKLFLLGIQILVVIILRAIYASRALWKAIEQSLVNWWSLTTYMVR